MSIDSYPASFRSVDTNILRWDITLIASELRLVHGLTGLILSNKSISGFEKLPGNCCTAVILPCLYDRCLGSATSRVDQF